MDYPFHVISPGSVHTSGNRYFVPSYLDRSDQLGPTTSTTTTLRLHPIPSLYFCPPQGIMNYRDCGSSGGRGDDTGMIDRNQAPATRKVTSWSSESEAPSAAAGAHERVVGSHQLNNARKRQRLEAAIALLKMERPRRNSSYPIEVPWEQPHEHEQNPHEQQQQQQQQQPQQQQQQQYQRGKISPRKKKSTAQPRPKLYVLSRGIGPIQDPNMNDVLSGRGGRINAHFGNVQLREMVNQRRDAYLAKSTKKLDKAYIAADIVQHIRTMTPPGRFLMADPDGLWYDIGDERAIRKVGQALREFLPNIREEYPPPNNKNTDMK